MDNSGKKEQEKDPTGAEKPVSLWGASFREVVGALLNTKPVIKEENTIKNSGKDSRNGNA